MGSRRGELSGRRKVPAVGAGFSQMHWMRLAATQGDLTEGIGVSDPEEKSCRKWLMEEVRQHNSREDAWMVLRGRVYNVTRYLPYHPGSIDEMMRSAGDDATVLFEEVHPWVNWEAMLEPCCVGVLDTSREKEAIGTTLGISKLVVSDDVAVKSEAATELHADEWRHFRVVACERVCDDSVLLRFAIADGRRLGLLVGEHVQVLAPSRKTFRAYTPVSPVKKTGAFELLVRHVPSGAVSSYLCTRRAGDVVAMRGPRGAAVYGAHGANRFRVPARAHAEHSSGVTQPESIVLITAGSGITPALALVGSLAAAAANGASKLPRVCMVHTSRTLSQVPMLEAMCTLLQALPSASFRLALPNETSVFVSADTPNPTSTPTLTPTFTPPHTHTPASAPVPATARCLSDLPSPDAAALPPLLEGAAAAIDVCVSACRLSAEQLSAWTPAAGEATLVFCCGPPSFNLDVKAWAEAAGHARANLHIF